MVNGYAVIPKYVVETINYTDIPLQIINDTKVLEIMDELVSLGKPLYADGIKIGNYLVKALLGAALSDDGWTVGYSLEVGTTNQTIFLVISHTYTDGQIAVMKGGL